MPYFSDPLDQNDPNKQQGQPASGAAPTAPPPSGQPAAGGAQPKPENTGSGFQNIDKYVAANSGQNFGNQVVGKVQGDVDKAGQSMQQAAQSFGQKVNANQAFGKDQVDQALADPSKADSKAFQAGLDQQYKGPNSLVESQDDYNKFTGDTSKAKADASALGSESGRFSLLDQYFGRQNYGFGQKSLDNALFQATPGAGQASNQVQQQANALQGQGKQMQDQLQAQASQRAGDIEQARNYERGQLGFDKNGQVIAGQGAFGTLQSDLASGLQKTNAQRAADQQAMAASLQGGNNKGYDLSDDQIKALGVDKGMSTYGVSLQDYIHNNGDLNMDQYASDDQRSKLTALNQLVGQNYSQNMLGDKQDATGAINFDKAGYLAAVDAAKAPGAADIQKWQGELADPTLGVGLTMNGKTMDQAAVDAYYKSNPALLAQLKDSYQQKLNQAQAKQAALQGMTIY